MSEITKPCYECMHCVNKPSIAGGYYCGKKKAITSIARITDQDGRYSNEECFEGVNDESAKEIQ